MKKILTVTEISTDVLWHQLLEIKRFVENSEQKSFSIYFHNEKGLFLSDNHSTEKSARLIYELDTEILTHSILNDFSPYAYLNKGIRREMKNCAHHEFIALYLPYCFITIISKFLGRAISISHFAQTLDGKIATNYGSSKWIGNEENLIHSHRMRALCDGILVGRKTIELDKPRLDVRHCAGENPQKIAIGNKNTEGLVSNEFIEITNQDRNCSKHIKINDDSQFEGGSILTQLFHKNIYSVFIEGGSKTSSAFLSANSIDEVQLHISPIVLGSGITNFQLPEVENISDGIQFRVFDFVKVGNAIMFKGEPVKK